MFKFNKAIKAVSVCGLALVMAGGASVATIQPNVHADSVSELIAKDFRNGNEHQKHEDKIVEGMDKNTHKTHKSAKKANRTKKSVRKDRAIRHHSKRTVKKVSKKTHRHGKTRRQLVNEIKHYRRELKKLNKQMHSILNSNADC